MVLNSLRKNTFLVALLFILIFIGTWLQTITGKIASYSSLADSFPLPIFKIISNIFPKNNTLPQISALVLSIVLGLLILNLTNKFILLKSRTYLPFLFYLLTSSAFIPIQKFNPALLASIFIFLAIDHVMATYQKRNPLDNIFRAGLSIGIASLIYAPSVSVGIWSLFALLTLRTFDIREWFVLLFAFTVPWLFVLLFYFALSIDFNTLITTFITNLIVPFEPTSDPIAFYIFISFLGLPFMVALLRVVPNLSSQKIAIRRYFTILIQLFLLIILTFILIPSCSYEIFYLLAIPASFIYSSYFVEARDNFWNNLLFALPIIGAIIVQILIRF